MIIFFLFSEPGFLLSPMRPSSPSTDGSLIFSSTPSAGSPYSPSSSPWSSIGGHATPTNLGSFSGSYSYVSPSNSFASNQSGHVSFDRVRFLNTFIQTVKPVLSSHSQKTKTKVLKTKGSYMKVESIAECSNGLH